MSAILDHPVNTYDRGRIEKAITERTVAEQLVPMLIAGAVPDRSALVEAASSLAGRFVALEPGEDAYVAAIGRAELILDHLYPSAPEEAARLSQHPALLWKIANVRDYLKRDS